MDLDPFRLDIDELINEFAEGEMTSLADMKRIWLFKKFSCIYAAKPSTKLGFFMQSLYAHSIGYMTSTTSLSHRLGGLYCLYCLHETQPFKPPFRIYICTREMKRLKELITDAKKENIGVVAPLVNSMLDRNLFLFGAFDLKEGSTEERVKELTEMQNARIQHANKKLFADTQIKRYIHMDMGKEVDLDSLTKMSRDYYIAKELAIKEAEKLVNTQDIKHIAENQTLIGDIIGKTTEDWNIQKETFYQKTGLNQGLNQQQLTENLNFEKQNGNGNLDAAEFNANIEMEDAHAGNDDDFCDVPLNIETEDADAGAGNDDNFCDELEKQLSSWNGNGNLDATEFNENIEMEDAHTGNDNFCDVPLNIETGDADAGNDDNFCNELEQQLLFWTES
uniref:uncharacterized protein LOC122602152 n=1 Tax=Erigeron canadensis TaxID=72917 RepID=UPI001CB93BC9|nr:uncharacterized protein LOC122602152 [Erigeron canadensis]XP_043630810.1 uncharacterized protein LOC122602152 [Erigeron canadensis]